MTAIPGAEDRNLVPRWRSLSQTAQSGELHPTSQPLEEPMRVGPSVERARAFSQHPGVFTAADLLGQAVVDGYKESDMSVTRAARLVLESEAPPSSKEMARHVLGTATIGSVKDRSAMADINWRGRANTARRIVRSEPDNAIRWVDLSLAHVNLGELDKAFRELTIAQSLSPGNRYILRSMARLAVLRNEPRAGLWRLARDADSIGDPWVLASHLALAEEADLRSRHTSLARKIVDRDAFSPWDLSELASGLATIEFRAGNDRKAKKLMRLALRNPTENAVAQAEWSANKGLDIAMGDALLVPQSFEARARASASDGAYEAALRDGLNWLSDQSFAPEPAVFCTYVATIGLEEHATAIRVARRGLVASPDDRMLRNNLAFALICSGDLEAGKIELDLAESAAIAESDPGITIMATKGLYAFRSGDAVAGHQNYKAAVDAFVRRRELAQATLASLLWAREELTIGCPTADHVTREALTRARRNRSMDSDLWAQRVGRMRALRDPSVGVPNFGGASQPEMLL